MTAATSAAVGSVLPDIDLEGPDAATSTLHRVRAGRSAVVYFMRTSTCPVCNRHLSTLVAMAERGGLGERALVALTPGAASEAQAVRARHPSPRIEVWSTGDGHGEVGLGVFLALQHSGVFLLDEDGTVAYRRSGAVPVGNLDAGELGAALAA